MPPLGGASDFILEDMLRTTFPRVSQSETSTWTCRSFSPFARRDARCRFVLAVSRPGRRRQSRPRAGIPVAISVITLFITAETCSGFTLEKRTTPIWFSSFNIVRWMRLLNASSCRIRLRKVQCRCIDSGTSAARSARFCSTEGVGDSTTGSGLWQAAKTDKAATSRILILLKLIIFCCFANAIRLHR